MANDQDDDQDLQQLNYGMSSRAENEEQASAAAVEKDYNCAYLLANKVVSKD